MECTLQYVGQTGRPFQFDTMNTYSQTDIIKNIHSAQNTLNTGHIYGNMQYIIETVQITKKGRCLNSLQKYCIYCIHQENEQINETLITSMPYLMSYINTTLPNNTTR
jgi:hypothetical protein